MMTEQAKHVVWLENCGLNDSALVGGKNAPLGEMIRALAAKGIKVPPGFATTTESYRLFVEGNNLGSVIGDNLAQLNKRALSLPEASSRIRHAFLNGQWPDDLAASIKSAYAQLSKRLNMPDVSVAVRSSATAEDLGEASFAGQFESFLNIQGSDALLDACRRCYASLFTDRAVSYRIAKGFDHQSVLLSVGVQQMVRAEKGCSGVAFSIDPETGFDRVIMINASWGLGENIVHGTVEPDEYGVFKPFLEDASLVPIIEKRLGSKEQKLVYGRQGYATRNVPTSKAERSAFVLSDEAIVTLAQSVCTIEDHFKYPLDIEWARDGESGEIYVVQARPETVYSNRDTSLIKNFTIKTSGKTLIRGLGVGNAVAAGSVCLMAHPEDIDRFVDGCILVTASTDPDWLPIMLRSAGIITDQGGRTSHAAIVSRELGVPAVIGTGNATDRLHAEQEVTISCTEGDAGIVYEGIADFDVEEVEFEKILETDTKVMLSFTNPTAAFRWWRLPASGVGLVGMEYVIGNHLGVHPMALVHFDRLRDDNAKRKIAELTSGYSEKTDYFVEGLARGLARAAAAFHPKPVIVRMSDFGSNEYAKLTGGGQFEPREDNPFIGVRGASRYCSQSYQAGFELECRAIRYLRDKLGFSNVAVMIPFCRSTKEADRVLAVLAEFGLERGRDGLKIHVMCEIPSNIVLARDFARRFDGITIGSDDLTQLTLGIDLGCDALSEAFDEQNAVVKWMIGDVINEAHKAGTTVGICGHASSDHPEFAKFLVDRGIDSISVTPDSFVKVKRAIANEEVQLSIANPSARR